jgi:hypothetical protein
MESFKQSPDAFLVSFRFQDLNQYYGSDLIIKALMKPKTFQNHEVMRHLTNLKNSYSSEVFFSIVNIMYPEVLNKKAS